MLTLDNHRNNKNINQENGLTKVGEFIVDPRVSRPLLRWSYRYFQLYSGIAHSS